MLSSKGPDAQAPEGRGQDGGTGPQRNTQPASRGDRRSAFSEQPLLRPPDLLQTRYEMLRRHRIEGQSIVEATLAFGVSRPTFYHAQTAFAEKGLTGLLPRLRGPKGRHKLSSEVLQHILALKSARPNCHDSTLRPGDSTTLRDQRSSPQSRTRSAEQKKTARSALTDSDSRTRYRGLRDIARATLRDRATRRSRRRIRCLNSMWPRCVGAG